MERETVAIYEERGAAWAAGRRTARRAADAAAFAGRAPRGAVRVDLGAGAGRYTAQLGQPVIALDAARTMLSLLREATPNAMAVQGDLEFLPFRPQAVGAAWASMSYLHVPRARLAMALARLHWALRPGAPVDIQVLFGDHEGTGLPGDDIGGRFFAAWREQPLRDVLVGAGFDVEEVDIDEYLIRVLATRALSLPDTVGPGMGVLVCGLNPSIYAAERGAGFARPGNRFWKAAIAAGLVDTERDTEAAFRRNGVGMTDLVKRATVASAEVTRDEYRQGAARVARMVEWLQPRVVAFVGLEGWRAAVDPSATAGPQPATFGGRPAYVLPSTSGRNASSRLEHLVEHLRAVAELARFRGSASRNP